MDLGMIGRVYLRYQHMDWVEEVLMRAPAGTGR